MSETLEVAGLSFELRRSGRRKTVGITVGRDSELIVSAPVGCPTERVERVVKEKTLWVHTKLAEKRLLARPHREKEFVNGEGFSYLGKSYRLRLIDGPSDAGAPPLRLKLGRFELRRDEVHRGWQHFVRWYAEHGERWIRRKVDLFADRIGIEPGTVNVRDLGYRWGSCGKDGNLNFHWRAVCLPPRILEYLVAHELVHLLVPHHGKAFWERLERCMPDAAVRRRWLTENGRRF